MFEVLCNRERDRHSTDHRKCARATSTWPLTTLGSVRRGRPRILCSAGEPVGQHGGGGLPREPWIGALRARASDSCISLPTPRRAPSGPSTGIEVAAMEIVHVRCAGLDVSKKDAKVCVRVHRAEPTRAGSSPLRSQRHVGLRSHRGGHSRRDPTGSPATGRHGQGTGGGARLRAPTR
jgi:hypothetical protein